MTQYYEAAIFSAPGLLILPLLVALKDLVMWTDRWFDSRFSQTKN